MEQRKNPELYALTAPSSPKELKDASSTGNASAGPGGTSAAAARPATVTLLPHKPEVLAPAGGWPQLCAAVENGADAVYFGKSLSSVCSCVAGFRAACCPCPMALCSIGPAPLIRIQI